MSEYLFVEKPFLDHLHALGWEVIDQGAHVSRMVSEVGRLLGGWLKSITEKPQP